MKKLLLVLGILFISCEYDTEDLIQPEVEQVCECLKYTEVRTIMYDSNYNTVSDTGFQENGTVKYYSDDCDDDGLIIAGHSGQFPQQYIEFRYNVKCN